MSTDIVKQNANLSPGERFTNNVLKEFNDTSGVAVSVTNFQRKLIKNFFIKLDGTLKEADSKRLGKKEEYRDQVPVIWDNLNMNKLAVDVMSFSLIGLDPIQPNHLNLIPYKNNKTGKYDIGFIIGYRGLELKAKKYGFEIPDDVIVELVYENDKFKSFKKSKDNRVESYDFEIQNDFDRGPLRGGFYYHSFYENPEKNKLRVFTAHDIEKRKPKSASVEFWGGEKDVWENKKIVGKETVEGWYDEMAWKTIYRAAYNDITIDSEKIDEHFVRMIEAEAEQALIPMTTQEKVNQTIQENGNKQLVDIEEAQIDGADQSKTVEATPPVENGVDKNKSSGTKEISSEINTDNSGNVKLKF